MANGNGLLNAQRDPDKLRKKMAAALQQGLLDSNTPNSSSMSPQMSPSLLSNVEEWAQSPVGQMDPTARMQETNRQRSMAGYPGYPWIGPQPSWASRIADTVRYKIPRAIADFGRGVATETPRSLLAMARDLGFESVGGPGGWITNTIDQPYSPRAPETGAGKVGGFGGMMATEVAAGLGADVASAKRGVGELLNPEGSTKLGLLELASSVPFLGMAAVPALRTARQGLDAMSQSRLEKFFLDTPQGKATGSQWLATLKKAPGGISKNEMEWTGIEKLLSDNPDRKFTRTELQQHMADHGIKLKETWRTQERTGPGDEYGNWNDEDFVAEIEDLERQAHQAQQRGNEELARGLWDEVHELTLAQEEFAGVGGPGTPKFRDHRIEGPSKNYRELTIQLEQPNQPKMDRLLKEQKELTAAYRTPDGDWVSLPPEVQVKYDALTEQILQINRLPRTAEFTGGHFPENNVLVHLRMSDRTVINPKTGKPETVLFIEEIQSDWHQKGRDKGYVDPKKMRALDDELLAGYQALEALEEKHGVTLRQARRNYSNAPVDGSGEAEKWWKIQNEMGKAEDRYKVATRERTQMEYQVPQGPYQNTDEWAELAMKRAIQEAVEGGYDRVAWASGEQASKLYDLRKHVTSIDYDPNTGKLEAHGLDGETIVSETGITPEQLPDYIGKEPAERLLSAKPSESIEYWIDESFHPATGEPDFRVFESRGGQDRWMNSSHSTRADAERRVTELNEAPAEQTQFRTIEGEDLEVGGEGMIGFYDRIIPRTTKKYGNQVGGIEIEGVSMSGRIPDGAEDLTLAQLKQGASELGLADDPLVRRWIELVEVSGGTSSDGIAMASPGADGIALASLTEQRTLKRYEDRILGHLKTSPESGVMTNQSFAITPEMRAKVGEEGQRLYSVSPVGASMGLLGAARMAEDKKENEWQGIPYKLPSQSGLLSPMQR